MEMEGTRCRWCYVHRTLIIALGSAVALCLLFLGAIFMAHFADRTPGWTLLIASACAMLGSLSFLVIMNIIRSTCPRLVVDSSQEDSEDSESEAEKIAAGGTNIATVSLSGMSTVPVTRLETPGGGGVFIDDNAPMRPDDDFEL